MSFSRATDYQPEAQDRMIGLFVLIAIAVILYLILNYSAIRVSTTQWVHLHTQMTNTHGLSAGTAIELSGVKIGTVGSVSLQADTQVAVELLIEPARAELLRRDSYFVINSELGLDTVLSGVRLELVPGQKKDLLQSGDTVLVEEPQSMDELLQEFDIERLAIRAQEILNNLEKITAAVAGERESIANLLVNLEKVSEGLHQTSTQLPLLVNSINDVSVQLDESLSGIDGNIEMLVGPLQETVSSASGTLIALESALVDLQPTLQALPLLLSSGRQAAQSFGNLSDQLASHWLFGDKESVARPLRPMLLPDDELYPEAGDAAQN